MAQTVEDFCIDGAIAAPVTPLLPNGDVDLKAFSAYADFLVSNAIDGIFILGTLGEGMSFTIEERKSIAAEWVEQGKERFKYVIVHVGAGNLRDSIELAKHAGSINASAIACMSPSFFKPDNEETMVEYLKQVAAEAPHTPFYYYDINFMTGVYNLNTSKVLDLSSKSIPTFRGLKMSSRELPNLLDCTLVCGGRHNIMVGTNEQFMTALSLNVRVPVLSGFLGKLFKQLMKAFDEGDMEAARKEQCLAREITRIVAKHGGGPPLIKAVLKCLGIDLGPVRLPLKSLPDSKVEELKKDLKEIGFIQQ